jgi:hypothetical protein
MKAYSLSLSLKVNSFASILENKNKNKTAHRVGENPKP